MTTLAVELYHEKLRHDLMIKDLTFHNFRH